MLKYLYTSEVFREVPGEITLGISISGCQVRCKGCHSRDLWEDKGKELTVGELGRLLNAHKGVSCVCLFGGEHDIDSVTNLFMYAFHRVKTAWYCGLDILPKNHSGILDYLDYIKLGRYDMDLGPLNESTTNQRLYKVSHPDNKLTDITSTFWKDGDKR